MNLPATQTTYFADAMPGHEVKRRQLGASWRSVEVLS